ncbi:MAG: transposase [Acidimicrobiia bacterium]
MDRVRVAVEAGAVREARPRLTNGIAESNNASIGRIRTNARGFHDPEAFITMIMLDRARLAPAALARSRMTPNSDSCP